MKIVKKDQDEIAEKKLNVLWWSDSPTGHTGLGTVAKNLLKYLAPKYNIHVLGVNFDGDPYKKELPIEIFPATSALKAKYNDLYGRAKLCDLLATGKYDILYFIQDIFNVEPIMQGLKFVWKNLSNEKKFASIYYLPCDAYFHKRWIENILPHIDFPVAYTNFAKERVLDYDDTFDNMPVIYHGVNTDVYRPLAKDYVERYKQDNFIGNINFKNRFIVLNVNRNQTRKDWAATFEAFRIFQKKNPDAFLFCLCGIEDQGGNLLDITNYFGLKYGRDWFAPINYAAGKGFSEEDVNMFYNMADMVISTTLGEGFGLSTIEGMACKRPLVFPNNTALTEIFDNGERGWLVPVNGDPICNGHLDNGIIRKRVIVAEFADYMEQCRQNEIETQRKVETAYEWAITQTWEKKAKEWEAIFEMAQKKFKNYYRS